MEKENFGDHNTPEDMSYLARNIKDLKCFNFRQGDIFLLTYPKSGTHWMMYIIWGILHKGEKPPGYNDMKYGCLFPKIEFSGTNIVETMKSPRTLRTHLSEKRVPYSAQAKYIHVTRNPFDCCMSYHSCCATFCPKTYGEVALDHFFHEFLKGDSPYGDYFQHVLEWYKHKDDDNYLHVTYEEISKDHRGSILKVAKFLGEYYYRVIANDEELLKRIEYHSSFSFMKSLPKSRTPKYGVFLQNIEWGSKEAVADDDKFREIELFRGGQVGDFKKTLSKEQKKQLRKKMEEKFRDTDLLHLWDEVLLDS